MTVGLAVGPDGRARCSWALSAPEYLEYHDLEWGRPVTSVQGLYERLTLEAFQSGLSWITILRKREHFRRAFAGFDPEQVARFDTADVERLMNDPGIVRNRAKVTAAIDNAEVVAAHGEAFAALILGFRAVGRSRPEPGEVPAMTPESAALARELRRMGIRFVGATTAYSLMQSVGLVDDHVRGCSAPGER